MNLKKIIENMQVGVIGYNTSIAEKECFGKPVLEFDGLNDKDMAEAYWKLDGNAFDSMAAEKYVKLDTLIMGGVPVCLFLDKDNIDFDLKSEYNVDLSYYPIGFMDLHKKQEGDYVCSGLGIAKQYQGIGLSKYLISAGIEVAGVENLIIPTQLSNDIAIKAWKFLGNLEVIAENPLHNENDTMVYEAKGIESNKLQDKLDFNVKKTEPKKWPGYFYGRCRGC